MAHTQVQPSNPHPLSRSEGIKRLKLSTFVKLAVTLKSPLHIHFILYIYLYTHTHTHIHLSSWQTRSKVLYTVTLYSKYARALTFQNLGQMDSLNMGHFPFFLIIFFLNYFIIVF
jgi:hypothetical protein